MNYTVNERYQVDCSICGHLSSERTFVNAKRTAQFADMFHHSENEQITISDIMAHRGKPDLYTNTGEVISTRD